MINIPSGITSVTFWYRQGRFTPEGARGAFLLAHLQALDGLGGSVHEWMGMTRREYDAWMANDVLPPLSKQEKS